MKTRTGFILAEVILGLFFMGLFSITFLPLIGYSFNNIKNIRYRDEMNYIGEMVVEKIMSKNKDIDTVISDLDISGEVNYTDEDFDSSKYSVRIIKEGDSSGLLEFSVIVQTKEKDNDRNVIFKSSIPK